MKTWTPTLGDVEGEIRDAEDLMLVVGVALNAERGFVPPRLRDALATTVRLAGDRIAEARAMLQQAESDPP